MHLAMLDNAASGARVLLSTRGRHSAAAAAATTSLAQQPQPLDMQLWLD